MLRLVCKTRGFAMIEILMAFLALSGGLLAVMNFHSAAQIVTSDAKTQAEAVAVAEQKWQELQSALNATDIRFNDGTYTDSVTGTMASFTRSWTVATDETIPNQKILGVSVSWTDRTGDSRSVQVGSELFFETPTKSIASMLKVIAKTKQVASLNVWGAGSGTQGKIGGDGDGEGSGGGSEDSGNKGGSGEGGGNGDGGGTPGTYTILVTSSFSKANDSQLGGMTVSDNNYPVDCGQSGNSWTCTSELVRVGDDLTFTITFHTSETVCIPGPSRGSGSYHFSNLNHDISSGYPVVIRKKANQC